MKRSDLVNVYKNTLNIAKHTTSHDYKQSEKWHFLNDLPPDNILFEGATAQLRSVGAKIAVVNADT